MNCHGNNNEDNNEIKGRHNHSKVKYILHMILCCGLPILIFLSLPFIARISPGTSGILALIVPFICPLMMIGMIPMMFGGRGDKKRLSNGEIIEDKSTKQLELKVGKSQVSEHT